MSHLKKILLEKYLDWRLNFFKNDDAIRNFPEDIRKIKNILIIAPLEIENSESFRNFTSGLYEIFENARVSTFQKESLRSTDRNWLGVPNEEYLLQLKQDQFDLVIDLNLNQDKICAYLGALSGAPVRLNLSSGKYDHVYNLHFRVEKSKSLNEKYTNILNYLKSLNLKTNIEK